MGISTRGSGSVNSRVCSPANEEKGVESLLMKNHRYIVRREAGISTQSGTIY